MRREAVEGRAESLISSMRREADAPAASRDPGPASSSGAAAATGSSFFSQPHRKSSGELLMLSSALPQSVIEGGDHSSLSRGHWSVAWLLQRSHVASAACLLYGYTSTVIILTTSSSAAGESLSSPLMHTAQDYRRPMSFFWIGQLLGLTLSSTMADGYGRRFAMLALSSVLAATLLILSFIPHELIYDTCAWFTEATSPDTGMAESWEEEAVHAVSSFIVGTCSSALLLITIIYMTEVSKTKTRGYELAKAIRYVIVGSISALVVLVIVAAWLNGGLRIPYNSSALPHWGDKSHISGVETTHIVGASNQYLRPSAHRQAPWRVRVFFLQPALASLFVAMGTMHLPDSPYWLMAYRTPFDCIKSLRALRGANDVGAEYVSIYRSLSREACRDSSWSAFLAERPLRYLLLIGAAIGMLRLLSGIRIIALYGDVLLRLSGFYALIESGAVQDECSADKATHMYFGGKRKLVEDNLNMDGLYNSGSATGLSSTLISGVDIGLVVVGLSAVAGAWAGTRFLRSNGSRRMLLFLGVIGMVASMLISGAMLSGTGALRLLNADTVHAISTATVGKIHGSSDSPAPTTFPTFADVPSSVPTFHDDSNLDRGTSENSTSIPTGSSATDPTFAPNATISTGEYDGLHLPDSTEASNAAEANAIKENYTSVSPIQKRVLMTARRSAASSSTGNLGPNYSNPRAGQHSLPDFFLKDADSPKYTMLRRCSFFICLLLFVFSFFGSIFLLNLIIIPESLPLRMRAKGLSIIFGLQFAFEPVLDAFYAWCGGGSYFRIVKSAFQISTSSLNSANNLVCFDEWIDDSDLSIMPSLAELLVISAILSIAAGAFLFLALPETHHVSLTDVEDLYDVSEYDLYFGCCPHGKGAGYLGLRVGTLFVDHNDSVSERSNVADDEDYEFWSSRPVAGTELLSEGDLTGDEDADWEGAGHLTATEEEISRAQLNFLPTAAFSTYRDGISRKRHASHRPRGMVANIWSKIKGLVGAGEPNKEERTGLLKKKSRVQKSSRNSSRDTLKGNSAVWDTEALASANLESSGQRTYAEGRLAQSTPTSANRGETGSYGTMSPADVELGFGTSITSGGISLGSIADFEGLIPGGTSMDNIKSGRSTPTSLTGVQASSHQQRHKYSGSMSSVQFQYDD